MKFEKLSENIHPSQYAPVQVKSMGNIFEIRSMSKQPEMSIKKLDRDCYIKLDTGEIKTFRHAERRIDNLASVSQSLKHLREYINSNVIDPKTTIFITLTYAENMQDPQRLYEDFRKFNMRLCYYIRKNSMPRYEYIVAIEPQARGSLHAHLLLIFAKKAPFIPHDDLADIWGHGFVKIKRLKNVDNIGAYLSAYLGDMELTEAVTAHSKNVNGFKIAEYSNGDKMQKKAIVKGARLKLYPKSFRLFRKSRGIMPPIIENCTNAEAMQKVEGAALTYEKTIRIADNNGNICNIINYRHYNKRHKQSGGSANAENDT